MADTRRDRKTEDSGRTPVAVTRLVSSTGCVGRPFHRFTTDATDTSGTTATDLRSPSSVPRLRGFTFVELLVTMALITILLPVVMQTIGLCTRLAGQSRRQIEAASLAKTKLTELIASQDWENTSNRGDFGTDWPGYEWAMTLANWTEDAAVQQLDLTVSWRSIGRQREITLSTLVYPQEQ